MPLTEVDVVNGFFEYIYGNNSGWVYVATKVPENQHQFRQSFFEWPKQQNELVDYVLGQRAEKEVYFAPALFAKPSALKEDVWGAQVVWVEFDGNTPTEISGIPEPTLRVRSSEDGHEHWYWRLDQVLSPDDLEKINRALTYLLGSDTSGWDAGQILRPPATLNHKRQRPVEVLERADVHLPAGLFDGLPQPPPPVEEPVPDRIPAVEDVVARYQWPKPAFNLFRTAQAPVGKRSSMLMSLGFYCAEMNMVTEDFLAILMNADQRWGKFYGRSDRMRRLMEIVTRARLKYPYRASIEDARRNRFEALGFLSLLKQEVTLEWQWDGLLSKQGYFLLTGPSGIGKTTVSLDVASSMALGSDALDRHTAPARIGFFSLEMSLPELKHFLMLQKSAYTQEELETLEDRLKFVPLGEPLSLNRKDERELINDFISDYKLDGIVIDSLGSSTEEDLSDESIKKLMNWNDTLRSKRGVWTWFIHHHRKATSDNKKPNALSDVYGSMFITRNATSVVALWDSPLPNTLEVRPLKVRLAERPAPFNIRRGKDLKFTRLVPGVGQVIPKEAEKGSEEVTEEFDPEQPLPKTDYEPGGTIDMTGI